jgi:hypothetical protein
MSFLGEHRGALSAGKGRGEGATLDPPILAFQSVIARGTRVTTILTVFLT